MAVNYQLVIDCTDPERLARFGLPPCGMSRSRLRPASPSGMSIGLTSACRRKIWDLAWSRISDPGGAGPHIWFQVVPKASCNEARIGVTSRGYWRLPRHNSRFRARLRGGVTPRP